ncbi:Isopentenyldiphosphate isomerase [Lutibacter agarilyticus]|uniref:Isopentenyldiphosphate isomerase n=1 Tax=Lutibacter agarilyticus TaxID=1109740 RepID=A0A238Z442_9FLAO|nr:NUDIX domain-containing protein [Lutibacter agarilyticus]SNR77654.1 Isopentenyldiphosphate isomerase [Lutibacter agarilyticus]
MDEYIDILNELGERTGETCLKSEAHKKGIFHASVHIWIFDKHKNVLIQKRATDKDTFPNLWDISVAGHISAREKPLDAALREVEEEIGLIVTEKQLCFIGISKKRIEHHSNLIDNELHYIYVCEIDFKISQLKIQKEEVSAIKSIHLDDLIEKVKEPDFVPRTDNYYPLVFENIKNYITN